jgi:hypothetical protein
MKIQKFVVTIESQDVDGCGNPIPPKTEGNVRIALCEELNASSITVEEIKEG